MLNKIITDNRLTKALTQNRTLTQNTKLRNWIYFDSVQKPNLFSERDISNDTSEQYNFGSI